jgi:ABC-type glycerol-3-phosphate transport system substrate-binding protein
MMNGFGFSTVSPDDNGYFSLNVGTEQGVTLFDKVYSLMSDKTVTQRAELIIGQGSNPSRYGFAELEEMFVSGRGLFYNTTSGSISILKARSDDFDFEFGVLPIPKFDEAQTNYYNTVNRYQSSVIGIPVSNTDHKEATCVLLQALGFHSKGVTKAYYQQTLQLQALTDNNDAEMLDLIYSNRFYDIGAMFEWGNSALINFYGSLINNASANEIVSRWDSISTAVETDMQATIDAFESSLT